MSLAVYILGRDVARLGAVGNFRSEMTYPDYANNPPGIAFMGRKTWSPGKSLPTFITVNFGVPAREQALIVEAICDAMIDVALDVRAAMTAHAGFHEIGKRMLLVWQEGISSLREKRTYSMSPATLGEAVETLSDPAPVKPKRNRIGQSQLLGKRGR